MALRTSRPGRTATHLHNGLGNIFIHVRLRAVGPEHAVKRERVLDLLGFDENRLLLLRRTRTAGLAVPSPARKHVTYVTVLTLREGHSHGCRSRHL